jgi:hypothetical protein
MTHLATYVRLLLQTEQALADSLRVVGEGHAAEADVFHTAHLVAGWSDEHVQRLAPVSERLSSASGAQDPERLHHPPMTEVRQGPVGLLRDLQDVHLLATLVQTSWSVVGAAAQGSRDHELIEVTSECSAQTARQLTWLLTRMKEASPQALLVAS